jgi:dimethyl-sulfide monooxygenase
MAAVTSNVGFGITAAITYEPPYLLARRLSTLDHLTKGRVAWNVVSSYLNSAALNVGMDKQISHDERYDLADEYMDVMYKLWEGSWEDGAVHRNKETGVFTDPSKVHPIRHQGKYYKVPGFHLCEPSPQRTPFIFQAGASGRGRQFAASHAEGCSS